MTGGKDPKLHHCLSQMLLRRFTDAKGRLAFYTKVAPATGGSRWQAVIWVSLDLRWR
jgi:hypothetical protein